MRSDTGAVRPPWLEPSWQLLAQRLQSGSLPHALLLLGAEGIGKRGLAERLAAALLCQQRGAEGSVEAIEACGECRDCQLRAAGSHPDYHLCALEADSKVIKIDQIRAVAGKLGLTSSGQYRVLIIDPADRMNVNAANALLKTLEEPSAGAILILLAESRARLPATVLSRCQLVELALPPAEQALQWLTERNSVEAEQLEQLLRVAAGSPGLAQDYLDHGLYEVVEETAQSLREIALGNGEPITIAANWTDEHLAQRLRWLGRWLVALASGRAEFRLPAQLLELLSAPIVQRSAKSLIILAEQANRSRALLESAARPELLVEDLLIDWQRLFASQQRMSNGR